MRYSIAPPSELGFIISQNVDRFNFLTIQLFQELLLLNRHGYALNEISFLIWSHSDKELFSQQCIHSAIFQTHVDWLNIVFRKIFTKDAPTFYLSDKNYYEFLKMTASELRCFGRVEFKGI